MSLELWDQMPVDPQLCPGHEAQACPKDSDDPSLKSWFHDKVTLSSPRLVFKNGLKKEQCVT